MTRKSLISLCRGTDDAFRFRSVDVSRVVCSLTKKLAAILFQVPDDIATLHWETMTNGSRITLRPLSASSASTRFASRTISTASCRFDRASSIVAPCVFAPGNSSTNAMYPSGTFSNTAVNFIVMTIPCRHFTSEPWITGRRHNGSDAEPPRFPAVGSLGRARCVLCQCCRSRRTRPRFANMLETRVELNRFDVESSRAGCLPERKVKEEREHIRGDFHSEVEHRVVHCPDHHRNLFISICPAKPKLVRHVPPILRPEVGTSHRDRFCMLVVEFCEFLRRHPQLTMDS